MLHIISGKFKNRRLLVPKGSITRPTSGLVRAAVFNILQNHTEGLVVLDLFAGSGAMGFEALSRGAQSVYFVEKDRNAAQTIKENIVLLKTESIAKLTQTDALSALNFFAKSKMKFDLIYIDPPYDLVNLGIKCIEFIDEHLLLSSNGWIILESGNKQEPPPLVNLIAMDSRSYGKSSLLFFKSTV